MALTVLVSSGMVLAGFVTGTAAAEPTAPRPVYAVTPLGDLGGGQSIARDINNSGQVVGQSQDTSRLAQAFLWESGEMKSLGTLGGPASFARGNNEAGQVVGFSRISSANNRVQAFLVQNGQPMTPADGLPTLAGYSSSEAWQINDSGVAVGRSFNSPSQGRAVLWENGQPKDLGPSLNTPYSEAWGINNLGQVVGEAGSADQQAKAFLYDNNTGEVTDIDASLDRLVFPYPFSEAAGINDHGQVIGWSYRTTTNVPASDPAGPEGKAFLSEKDEDGTATVLPLNPLDGDLYSRARDIDESGRAVGWSRGTSGDDAKQFSAVLWEGGKAKDLNELIPTNSRPPEDPDDPDQKDKSGWKLTDPYAINESGQIVGTGYHYDEAGNKGQLRAFLLTPDTTEPNLSVSHTADGSNGWNKTSPVTLKISAIDTGVGLESDPTCTDGANTLTLAEGSTAGTWTANVSGEGTHTISCSVSDEAGNTASASDTVKIDTLAPSAACNVTPNELGIPANNHKLVDITVSVDVTDSGSGADGFTLVSVTSNQADSGLGPDDLPDDIQGWDTGTNDTSGQLRTERYRKERIYTLTYLGKDLAGNTKACQATVSVPKGG
jgi:probable HAF family extracellular repeat protein